MSIQRTALGTAFSKTSGASLTLSSAPVNAGQSLLVGLGYETGAGAPTSVKWGFRELSQVKIQTQSGMAVAAWLLRHVNNDGTKNIVATWSGAINAKVMVALAISGAHVEDVSQSASQTATGSPATGASVDTTFDDTMCVAFFGSRGPRGDTGGTVNLGHTSGQRDGTAGAPPTSNVTLHETYEILTATGSCRSTKSGATSRAWANVIVALREATDHTQGISPTDMAAIEAKFQAQSLDFRNHALNFNARLDRWEVFDSDITTTLVAHSDNGWA